MSEMWQGGVGFQRAPIDPSGTLIVPSLHSPNFGENDDGTFEGWSLNEDGSAQFHEVDIGSNSYQITTEGNASFAQLDVASGDITLNGDMLLADILAKKAKGITAWAQITSDSSSTSGGTEKGYLELAATLEDGRMYRLHLSNCMIEGTVNGDDFRAGIRFDYFNSPTIANSQLIAIAVTDIFAANSDRPYVIIDLPFKCDSGEAINPNSDFGDELTGYGGVFATAEYETEVVRPGTNASMKGTPDGTHFFNFIGSIPSGVGTVTPGQEYVGLVYAYSPIGGSFGVVINWQTNTGTQISASNSPAVTLDPETWTLIRVRATAPATTSQANIQSWQGDGITVPTTDKIWYASTPKLVPAPDDFSNFMPGDIRFLLTLLRLSGTGTAFLNTGAGSYNPISLYLEDCGAIIEDTGQSNSGGGGTTQKQTYVKEYPATWGRSYRGGGATCGGGALSGFNQNGSLYQGYYSDCNANSASWIGFDFNKIQSDLSGATVNKCELFLYFNHWYFNSGGTAIIGTHSSTFNGSGDTGPSFNGALDDQDRIRVPNWPKPGGKWVNLGTGIGNEFKSGSTTGIVLGQGPSTNKLYYGHANDANSSNQPRLRITYTK